MMYRFVRELRRELYWLKKALTRRWPLDTSVGIVGVIAVLSGLGFFLLLGQGIAKIFRASIPWVAGTSMSTMYWFSIGLALKMSFVCLVFITSLLLLLWLKIHYRR